MSDKVVIATQQQMRLRITGYPLVTRIGTKTTGKASGSDYGFEALEAAWSGNHRRTVTLVKDRLYTTKKGLLDPPS